MVPLLLNTIGTNDYANGTIGSPNGTISKITNGTIGRTPNRARDKNCLLIVHELPVLKFQSTAMPSEHCKTKESVYM